jgi:hypothetical protein
VISAANLQHLRTDGESIFYRSISGGVTFFSWNVGGQPQELWHATTMSDNAGIGAVDDQTLYVVRGTGHGTARLGTMPKTGGTPIDLPTGDTFSIIGSVGVDRTHVYWHTGSAIYRMPKQAAPSTRSWMQRTGGFKRSR